MILEAAQVRLSPAEGRGHNTHLALAGNDTFTLSADAAFDGTVGRADLFKPSSASVPAGTHYYFATCENEDGRTSAALAFAAVTVA